MAGDAPDRAGRAPERSGTAFHGRRKGKRLRAGQGDVLETLLPRLRLPLGPEPIDLGSLFPRPMAAFELEIGFGGGEHLAARARAHPDRGFVGCEPFVNGMAKLLRAIAAEDLDAVRLWDRDAAELLPRLPPASLDRVHLLFPDPWPKRRQRKRRFVSEENLAALARAVKPGGEFRFATDIDDYAGWTLARVLRSPDWRWAADRPADWRRSFNDGVITRYEAKARAQGRTPVFLRFERT